MIHDLWLFDMGLLKNDVFEVGLWLMMWGFKGYEGENVVDDILVNLWNQERLW